LNTTIIIKDKKILFNWFHKPTFSQEVSQLLVAAPPLTEKGRLWVWLIEPSYFHIQSSKKNFEFIIKILLENDYPLDFIFNTISSRIKGLINDKIAKYKNNNVENCFDKKIWSTVPFIKTISEKFKSITNGAVSVKAIFFQHE